VVIDVSGGSVILLLPLVLLSVPGIILVFVLPAILLLALAVPLAVIGAVIAAPTYLLARRLRRRRGRTASPSGGRGSALRSVRTRGPSPVRVRTRP
jgi:membrane protein implicated in regulation of membrane protease activity